MKTFSRLMRLARIQFILIRYHLDEMIFTLPWFYPFRFLSYLNPWGWFIEKKYTRGERIRYAIEELGPIFVKAGQILSTRRDLLPDDIADELAKLQDRVPPFSGDIAINTIETSLKTKLSDVFSEFDPKALASASIAQVHAATLLDGREVVVKVLRPHIQKQIAQDLDLLASIVKLAEKYWSHAKSFKSKELVLEISQTLQDELDLLREGANASQLRRNFLNSDLLYVPKIYWSYSKQNVLVMERIKGIPIYQVEALKNAGIDMKKLAERGIEIFFTQVFRDSFFHADMHPGNFFISPDHHALPKFIAVDFGIVGSLNSKDKRYLAENLLADYFRLFHR